MQHSLAVVVACTDSHGVINWCENFSLLVACAHADGPHHQALGQKQCNNQVGPSQIQGEKQKHSVSVPDLLTICSTLPLTLGCVCLCSWGDLALTRYPGNRRPHPAREELKPIL
jgi:hypothetical protein